MDVTIQVTDRSVEKRAFPLAGTFGASNSNKDAGTLAEISKKFRYS